MIAQFSFIEMTDKWQIRKMPLWEGYPIEWQVVPPRDEYNRCVYNITCYRTGAEALSAFSSYNDEYLF